MIYVNTTGKHIGECLTGFGSSFPVFIYNSGNSDISYEIDVLNNTDIFSVSENEFPSDCATTWLFVRGKRVQTSQSSCCPRGRQTCGQTYGYAKRLA